MVDIPAWRRKGKATVVQYGTKGAVILPTANSPGPRDRGKNLFIGGPDNTTSELTQEVDVTPLAEKIDTGRLVFELSAYLGGYAGQRDHAVLTVTFLDREGKKLGEAQLGPVTPQERKGVTGLVQRSREGAVPAGVRRLAVRLAFTRLEGDYNDGSADNLSLVFRESAGGPAARREWRHDIGFFEKRKADRWFEEVFATRGQGKQQYHFVEKSRNKDYVELYDKSRDCTVRLYAQRCEVKAPFTGNRFQKFYDGKWVK